MLPTAVVVLEDESLLPILLILYILVRPHLA
jgi:hypothetical protein